MKCLLLAIAWSGVVAKQQEEYPDCLHGECAWWDEIVGQCLFKTLVRGIVHLDTDLKEITEILNELVLKMPHELQFRRKP